MGVDRRNPKDRQASISHLPGNTIIECRIGRYALAGYHPVMLHSQYSPREDIFHPVSIEKDSILGRLWGEQLEVNSFHHQCLNHLGRHLKITATAPDGVIEAVEMPDHTFVVGIQWHPEMLLAGSDKMLPLFQQLIAHCRRE